MPIVKVPQKHKFGIVSLNKVEGLLSLTRQQENATQRTSYPPLLQINQDFVIKYNSKPKSARESMDTEIKKALQHARYRAGVGRSTTASPKSSPAKGTILDVTPYDTSIAWLELALLCQCNGPLQEEVLQTLGASLNTSPLSTAHVPSLVYVAGLCYQWLKNDALSTDVLRTGELLLLKVLFYISLRLYYHHLAGRLMESCTSDEIRQLKYDIEGFENKERTYRYLPEALLNWKIALEVGLTICENYSKSVPDLSVQSCSSSGNNMMDPQKQKSASARSTSVASHGGSNISSILWHSLDIWQCTRQRCEVLQEAIQDFLACSTDFCSEKWLEGVLAINILCSTSQGNLDILNLLQSLAMGHAPTDQQKPSKGKKKPESTSFPTTKKASKSPELASLAMKPSKDTRFTLPSKKDYSIKSDSNVPTSFSKSSRVATLNVLGMQPDFNVGDADSVYTADQTVLSYQTKEGGERYSMGQKITKSADDIKFVQGRFPRLLPRQPMEATDYVTSFNSNTASSVGTQSLIANESIPDTLPSAEVSNVTMLDLGSITTLDPAESLAKSMGLFACSTSKNLDTFMSHLVSPGLIPSCELTSREDILTSAIPELSAENSVASDSELANPSPGPGPLHMPGQASAETIQSKDDPGLIYDKKKAAEVNWESKEHEKKISIQETALLTNTDEDLVQPQYVKMVTAEQFSRPDTQCTHYTHSTAPLADGANMLGSQVHPSTVLRQSMLSSESSCKTPLKKLPPFERWPSEVALTYTLCMGSISIYGKTSLIQRTALQGPKVDKVATNTVAEKRRNYGLLGLAGFETEDANNTEAWSVRHEAILGLSRVHKTCRSLPMKDGLSDMAFEKLMERQRVETDTKVSHAFTIAQASPDLDEVMVNGENLPLFSPLLAHIADGLGDLFLPPQPSYLSFITKSPEKQKQGANLTKEASSSVPNKKPVMGAVQSKVKASMTTKHSLDMPSFNTRTFAALEKITKEHWKRQMLEEKKEREMEQQERNSYI